MHSYPTRKRMKNTRFLSNSYTHILPQFLPNLQRDLPGNHAYGVCHSAFSEEVGHKGRLLRRMLTLQDSSSPAATRSGWSLVRALLPAGSNACTHLQTAFDLP